ncbi:tRNA preQ1(34) S-adenosylmethionine ribosyltransferase-isomerase QueA [Lentisalinibacter sediminis]|uniref:tRNA preQ1(34) S-adenosylmethionine ribosyltransferase-isomerase QueA n=1 Tax=Lentisalinibacter sediminis TaxID=2992237 RepID=UPI00386B76C5
MRAQDYSYELPDELIAHAPARPRSASRLLVLQGDGALVDSAVTELPALLSPGDLLVFNDTRVIPARIHGRKETGGRIELLLERVLAERDALCHLRASKSPRPGTSLTLEGGATATVTGREGDLFRLTFDVPVLEHLERHGHVPLPPYIRRPDNAGDRDDYQTVFAREPGAVAAPTAGLHFDQALLDALEAAGVQRAFVTLHVGAGTFQPLREENIASGRLHAEQVHVNEALCAAVSRTRERGGRVVAVGTTAVRSLETAAADGALAPCRRETELFIMPGYRFRVVDAMITNFHLPESSLLMLVSAFAGRDNVLAAYRHAVAERYRFYSYGDAMLVWPAPGALGLRP